ncbi:MAG: YggT family protein [Acidimicrobiales bacterium]
MPGFLCVLLTIYIVIIVVRVVLTWFPVSPGSPIGSINAVLATLTDPVLAPVRRVIPPVRLGGAYLDISAIVVIFGGSILLSVVGC